MNTVHRYLTVNS